MPAFQQQKNFILNKANMFLVNNNKNKIKSTH